MLPLLEESSNNKCLLLYNQYKLEEDAHEYSGNWTDEMFSEIISLPNEQPKVEPAIKVGSHWERTHLGDIGSSRVGEIITISDTSSLYIFWANSELETVP